VNEPLRAEQVRAALERHGYPPDTELLGVRYENDHPGGRRVLLNLAMS
jgi:hypothetical protein